MIMKNLTIILLATVSVSLVGPVMAENEYPPSGPYRSIDNPDKGNSTQNGIGSQLDKDKTTQSDQAGYRTRSISGNVPEWVEKRRIELEKRHNKNNKQPQLDMFKPPLAPQGMPEWAQHQQAQNEKRMLQRNQNPNRGWNNRIPFQTNQNMFPPVPNQGGNPQARRNQQYFPSSRGQIQGPGVPPPVMNNHRGYQLPRNWNTYPPMRR